MKQKDIVAKIRKLGYKVTVLSANIMNRSGIPDALISINGLAMFVEIKIDDDKPTKLQNYFMNEFCEVTFRLHYDTSRSHFTCAGKYDESNENHLCHSFLEMLGRLNERERSAKKRGKK